MIYRIKDRINHRISKEVNRILDNLIQICHLQLEQKEVRFLASGSDSFNSESAKRLIHLVNKIVEDFHEDDMHKKEDDKEGEKDEIPIK